MEYIILGISGAVLLGCLGFWVRMLILLKKKKQKKELAERPSYQSLEQPKVEERQGNESRAKQQAFPKEGHKSQTRGLFSEPMPMPDERPAPNAVKYSVHAASKKQPMLFEGKLEVGNEVYIATAPNGGLAFSSSPAYNICATLIARNDGVYIQNANAAKISIGGAALNREAPVQSGQSIKIGKTAVTFYIMRV